MRAPRFRTRIAALAAPFVLLAGCSDSSSPTAATEATLEAARLDVAPASSELFISEYIEGSSNNKAIEIYNGTGATVDLGAAGYNVQMFFNGNPSAGLTINLAGTVASGDVFVLAQSTAAAAILAQADQTSGAGFFNGDDAVVLRRGTTVLDVIGQIGFDPGSEWGTGLTSTADNTLRRKASICAGDTNGSDVFDPSVEWDGFATDVFDGLGAHTATCSSTPVAPTVASTTPASDATDVAADADITVRFSTPVTVTGDWYTISCATSGVRTATVSGASDVRTLDVSGAYASGETCTVTIAGAQVANAGSPTTVMTADYAWSFTAVAAAPCTQPFTPIYAIQGSGAATPIPGAVTTQGVVVGDYEGPGGSGTLRGFYLQDLTGDGDPATSDGVFVFNGNNNNVAVGDVVRVTGNAAEFQGQTQVSASNVTACGETATVAPVDITLPVPSAAYLERYEGMLVRFPQTLTVTDHFLLGRFGEVTLSSGGRLAQPTDVAAPGAAALAVQAANDLNRIIVDDELQIQNRDPITFGRGGSPLSAANTLRGGDVVTGVTGVLSYTWAGSSASGNAYRVRPVGALGGTLPDFQPANARPVAAPAVGGSLRVASFNVLNYFNTFSGCTFGVGGVSADCRGANNALEFDRQRAKIVSALLALDADIVGVIEIENDGYGPESALADLVSALNAVVGAGTWAFIDADAGTGQVNALGTDAIKVGLIYKPASVTPVGRTAVLNSPEFVNGGDGSPRNRPSLAQAFMQPNRARVVVDVNHFKSKGSGCDAADAGDLQGNCNVVRRNAAIALQAWLAADPTDTGEEDVLILGDLNAYAMEDPIALLEAGGYANLTRRFGGIGTYSYSFGGQWGSLDHALASSSLQSQVTGAADFHINADEPSVLDYDLNFKFGAAPTTLYNADPYRSSDHDPVVVGLNLRAPTANYTFSGFLSPVMDGVAEQVVIAGDALPLRFSLGGTRSTNVFAPGFPATRAVACGATSGAGNPFTPTVTSGNSTLRATGPGASYMYTWKTDAAWANTCRELVVRFNDESQVTRVFRFVP